MGWKKIHVNLVGLVSPPAGRGQFSGIAGMYDTLSHGSLSSFSFLLQKELFSSKIESAETGRDRKMSASSTGSMKSKWMKAFKSLKTPPSNGTASKEAEK